MFALVPVSAMIAGSLVSVLPLGLSGVSHASVSDEGADSEMEAQTSPPKRMLWERVERAGRRDMADRRRGADERTDRRVDLNGVYVGDPRRASVARSAAPDSVARFVRFSGFAREPGSGVGPSGSPVLA